MATRRQGPGDSRLILVADQLYRRPRFLAKGRGPATEQKNATKLAFHRGALAFDAPTALIDVV